MRFGVGNEFTKGKQVDYVLGKWNDEELKQDGLLKADSTATIENLTFTQFIPSLLDTYRARFPGLL